MIAFLRGKLASKAYDYVVLDVSGVGYKIMLSGQSVSRLPEIGTEIQLLTKMIVKEDDVALYGFQNATEQNVFERLISVSGIGPKAALSILSSYSAEEVIEIIASQDSVRMQKAPGIGKKTASRIILELKDVFAQVGGDLSSQTPSASTSALQGAREALLSMGFTSTEIDLALKDAPSEETETGLLQYALKRLGA
ncbi:MAG: Holliday junction branch migration protein RuvA [Eggerthellaceae bacterium]|nr:Holliday junction branch migration protein RuvA [Eggerthellaceae bacterium]